MNLSDLLAATTEQSGVPITCIRKAASEILGLNDEDLAREFDTRAERIDDEFLAFHRKWFCAILRVHAVNLADSWAWCARRHVIITTSEHGVRINMMWRRGEMFAAARTLREAVDMLKQLLCGEGEDDR